jgi:hypothetical protein
MQKDGFRRKLTSGRKRTSEAADCRAALHAGCAIVADAVRPERYEPMTLGNMRRNGVRSLAIHCGALDCHHQAVLEVDRYSDNVQCHRSARECGAPSAETEGLTRARIGWGRRDGSSPSDLPA